MSTRLDVAVGDGSSYRPLSSMDLEVVYIRLYVRLRTPIPIHAWYVLVSFYVVPPA